MDTAYMWVFDSERQVPEVVWSQNSTRENVFGISVGIDENVGIFSQYYTEVYL